ncbi:hypothetical protein [Roseobacter sp. CCS2]|uniref:hypothetical protein n=1 Tax=Roseobacter sp. CCS2 TaxID=391593 RepID=UPI0000F40679|nr:hypothetical protein [Roseobacter sp. CCS2]EBA11438.1 hypothetical protein RCCS2_02228 [Roseobacter sp. CCS2]
MRFVFGVLAMVLAQPAIAAPFMIEADRILGVYAISKYGENDWNRDDHADLAVIAISKTGDSVDLYLATSDPITSVVDVTEVAHDVLPYDPTRIDVTYDIGPAHSLYEPEIVYRSRDTEKMLLITTNPRIEGSGISRIATFQQKDAAGGHDRVCEIVFIPDTEVAEQTRPAYATIIGPDGVETRYDPGPEPVLTDWTWRDLPRPCLP